MSVTPPVYRIPLKDHISIYTHILQSSQKIQLLRQDCERLNLRPQGSRDNPTVNRAGQASGTAQPALLPHLAPSPKAHSRVGTFTVALHNTGKNNGLACPKRRLSRIKNLP